MSRVLCQRIIDSGWIDFPDKDDRSRQLNGKQLLMTKVSKQNNESD